MFAIYAGDLGSKFRAVFDKQVRLWAGAAFMALALISIEYEEVIAPSLTQISEGWNTAASDFSRKLASFTL